MFNQRSNPEPTQFPDRSVEYATHECPVNRDLNKNPSASGTLAKVAADSERPAA